MPENFSFFILEDGRPRFYRLRRDFIDLGGDYTLYDENNKAVGYIDGAVFTLGGKWRGRVRKENADPKLLMVLFFAWWIYAFLNDSEGRLYRWTDGKYGSPPAAVQKLIDEGKAAAKKEQETLTKKAAEDKAAA